MASDPERRFGRGRQRIDADGLAVACIAAKVVDWF
jgi:hypothetical protein